MHKNLFLTSSIHLVAQDIAKGLDLTQNNRLVYITTAAEPKTGDLSWLANDRKSLVDAGFDVSDYTITGKTKAQVENDLIGFEYIYLSGGNSVYLLQKSQQSGFIDIVKDLILNKGKTYIGTSAGSIIAGPKLHDYLIKENENIQLENIEGYNLVNFLILPHWGSEHNRNKYLKGRLEIAYIEDQLPLVALNDNQYIHIVDDDLRIIDVTVE
jgi:dipeptidase E